MDYEKLASDLKHEEPHSSVGVQLPVEPETFGITISPPHRNGRPAQLYKDDVTILHTYLNKVSHNYTLYPEFDYQSRLHYHGIIQFTDMYKWHKSIKYKLSKEFGYTKLEKFKTSKNRSQWDKYMTKDYVKDKTFPPIQYVAIRQRKAKQERSDINKNFDFYFHPR